MAIGQTANAAFGQKPNPLVQEYNNKSEQQTTSKSGGTYNPSTGVYTNPSGQGFSTNQQPAGSTIVGGGGSGSGSSTTSNVQSNPLTPYATLNPLAKAYEKNQGNTLKSQLENKQSSTSQGFERLNNPLINAYKENNYSNIPRPKTSNVNTMTSLISQGLGFGKIESAGEYIANQKANQLYQYQVSTQKAFMSDPSSFENKVGVLAQSTSEGTRYTLTNEYFNAYPTSYNIKQPSFIQRVADVDLSLAQYGEGLNVANLLGIKQSKIQKDITNAPTLYKTPVFIGVTGISVGAIAYSGYSNIKTFGASEGIVNTLEGLSPIRMNRQFTPVTNFNTENLNINKPDTFTTIKGNVRYDSTFKTAGEYVTGLKGDYLGSTKGSIKSFQMAQVNEEGAVTGVSGVISTGYKTIYSPTFKNSPMFKTTPITSTSVNYFNAPADSFKQAGAMINGIPKIGTYGEYNLQTITKSNGIFSYSESKAYGINVGNNKRFVYNTGDLNYKPIVNIKGTKATVGKDILTSRMSGVGKIIDLTPTSKGDLGYTNLVRGSSSGMSYATNTQLKTTPVMSFSKPSNIQRVEQVYTPMSLSGAFNIQVPKSSYEGVSAISYSNQLETTRSNLKYNIPFINFNKLITKDVSKQNNILLNIQQQGSRTFQVVSSFQSTTPYQTLIPKIANAAKTNKSLSSLSVFPNVNLGVSGFGFGLPQIGFQETGTGKRKKKRKKIKSRILPSFTSEVFNLQGSLPKSGAFGITPFQQRLIPKGRKNPYETVF